jgi:hypothetical protein
MRVNYLIFSTVLIDWKEKILRVFNEESEIF